MKNYYVYIFKSGIKHLLRHIMKESWHFVVVVAAFILLLGSCEKDPVVERPGQEGIIINNNLSLLGKRVNITGGHQIVPLQPVEPATVAKGLKSGHLPVQFEIYLRAEVDAPLHDGKVLQASHIKIAGDHAYVSYNVKGPEYLGGVDIFDVSDIRNPVLVSNVIFPGKDINSIDVGGNGSGNHVYLAGAANPGLNPSGLMSPALLERFILNSSYQFTETGDHPIHYDLPSYAGNDVRYHTGNIFATSGSGGGLSMVDNELDLTGFVNIPYARSVDADGDRLVVFSALESKLFVMDMAGGILREINAGGEHFEGDQYLQAKSIVRLRDNLAFLAAGTGGMEVYNIDTGEKAGSLPRPVEYKKADIPLNYVTNGVSVHNNLILVANGGSGVHIAGLYDGNEIETIGKFMFENGSSANFVEALDNKIFVATGMGGLKILEIVQVEPTEPCETLWERIVELLPEKVNIHRSTHPSHDLSTAGLPGTVELIEDAPVYITFLHNGAGWQNSFGYYSYHKDDAPQTVEELIALGVKEIVYPYVNESANGVTREMGERIRLGGDRVFEEGTIIGFYIVAQGWSRSRGQMVEGIHTVYTTPGFNPGGVRKHVLFLEESCLEIVLGFEDALELSDEDFNDVIFIISNGDDAFGNQTNYAIAKEGLPVK
jgi:hypothetical protein